MTKQYRRGKSAFDGLKSAVHCWRPVEALWLAFEGVKQGVEVVGSSGNESAVIVEHTEEPLEFFDGCRRFHFPDGGDAILEWLDAF